MKRSETSFAITLLVKDEVDVLEDWLRFHLDTEPAAIVVTDNGSEDGTRDVLSDFEKLGHVLVIDEPGDDYRQAEWVSRMAFVCRERFKVPWVINSDADEFWIAPEVGGLRGFLAKQTADGIYCPRKNVFCCVEELPATGVRDYRRFALDDVPVVRPVDHLNGSLSRPYLTYRLPPKMICATRGLVSVAQGNHDAEYSHAPRRESTEELIIHHFPVRSWGQIESKVRNGGSSYARNRTLAPTVGWHWRRWYHLLRTQSLARVVEDAIPTELQLSEGLSAGIYGELAEPLPVRLGTAP